MTIPPVISLAGPLGRAAADAFRTIPEGKRGALLVIADAQGTRLQVAAKLGEDWALAADAMKPWDGPWSGSVSVQGSW
ncbi:MAG TPA: hypothetical protein VK573_12290 [Gemmatimonadales bacterium]|nr:hypothetical protein [Gemmatimonadales bacterium]